MLAPKKTTYFKPHTLSYFGKVSSKIVHGSYAIVARSGGHLSAKQIEASRRVLSRYLKKEGQVWIRIFPHMAQTKKPNEVRMGNGKGNFDHWYCSVKINQILFEFTKLDDFIARKLERIVSSKLPLKTYLLKKQDEISCN